MDHRASILPRSGRVDLIGSRLAPSGRAQGGAADNQVFDRTSPALCEYPGAGRNTLVIVTDHTYISILRGQQPDQLVLGEVDVLVLIHQGVQELVLVVVA